MKKSAEKFNRGAVDPWKKKHQSAVRKAKGKK